MRGEKVLQEENYHMSLATNLFQLGDTHIIASKKVSGIYIISNKINEKIYIGESLDIYRRWHKEHLPQLKKISTIIKSCKMISINMVRKTLDLKYWNAIQKIIPSLQKPEL